MTHIYLAEVRLGNSTYLRVHNSLRGACDYVLAAAPDQHKKHVKESLGALQESRSANEGRWISQESMGPSDTYMISRMEIQP